MKTSRLLTSLLITCLMVAMAPPLQAESSNAIAAPLAAPGDNAFGYVMDTGHSFEWQELASETDPGLAFPAGRDDASVQVNLGFSMKFFERIYDKAFVSINGFLSFEDTRNILANVNSPIPNDDQPNSIVAPLWADLILTMTDEYTAGKVYSATGSDANGSYLVVEWYKVLVRGGGTGSPLTFELFLHENGDIVFSYQELPGEINGFTIGIEDSEGVDGVQYQYNGSTPSTGGSIAFHRPPDGPRVKAFPRYRGEFLSNQSVDFPITVRNTGTITDTYNLTYTILQGDLAGIVSFHEAGSLAELDDTDSNGDPDTGQLPPGEDCQIILRIISNSADTGEHLFLNVTVASVLESSKRFEVQRDAAVPAQFAQAINDGETGVNVLFSLPENQVIEQPAQTALQTIPALVGISRYVYLLTWEHESAPYSISSNIEYLTLDYLSRYTSPVRKVRDNAGGGSIRTSDTLPVVAATGDRIGILFIRNLIDAYGTLNQNVIFALLNSEGDLLAEIPITHNTSFGQGQGLNVDFFNYPALTATSDNKFILAWEKTRWVGTGDLDKLATVDIYTAALDDNGNVIVAEDQLTDSEASNKHFHEPVLTALKDDGAYLVFSVLDNNTGQYGLGSVRFSEDTHQAEKPYRLRENWSGTKPDAVELGSGTVLFAWSNLTDNKISYSIIPTGSTLEDIVPYTLENPTGLAPDYVSVTKDKYGNGVITWGDRQKDLLFYTLVTASGGQITPPMMFNHGIIPNEYRSFNGNMASAPLAGTNKNFVPLIGW